MKILYLGEKVRSVKGETDCDGSQPRTVSPGAIGTCVKIEMYRSATRGERFGHHVEFSNGCWIVLNETDLDSEDYEVVQSFPLQLASRTDADRFMSALNEYIKVAQDPEPGTYLYKCEERLRNFFTLPSEQKSGESWRYDY